MPNHILVVMTNPVEGREDEFNDWYTNVHLRDVVKLDGFISAQRFRFALPHPEGGESPQFRYLAIYEIEEDGLEIARTALAASAVDRETALLVGRDPILPLSDAMHEDRRSAYFEVFSPRVTAAEADSRASRGDDG